MLWGITVERHTSCPEHRHDLHEMIVCKSSGGRLVIDGVSHAFHPGRTFFIPSDKPHAIEASAEHPAEALFICVDRMTLPQVIPKESNTLMLQMLLRDLTSAEAPAQANEALTLCNKIEQAISSKSIFSEALFSNLFAQLIIYHCMSCTVEVPDLPTTKHSRVSEIRDWINEHYASPITLDDMAAKAAMSRSVFSRLFRRHIGMSLMDYCMQVRAAAAARLIGNTDTAITDIALQVGFSNLSHFHRIFKRQYSMTPGQYRKFLLNQGMSAVNTS
jgi:AraC-like DNA-binding protein